MSISHRQGVQAIVAVLIAGTLALIFHLSHAYWVTITAGVLIMPSWGQGLERAIQRLMGTAAGCVVGLAAAWLVDDPLGQTLLALLAFTVAVYHFGANYTHMMFWVSCFLMLVFSLSGHLSLDSFLARVVDTLLGAAVATLVSMTVLATHSRNRFRQVSRQYFNDMRDLFHDAFCLGLLDEAPQPLPWPDTLADVKQPTPAATLDELPAHRFRSIALFQKLREAHRLSLYEGIFVRFSRRRSQRIVEELHALTHYVTDFTFAVVDGERLAPAAPYREELRQLHAYALSAYEHVRHVSEHRGGPTPDSFPIEALRRELRARILDRLQAGDIHPEQVLSLVVALNFVWQMIETLDELAETLRGA